MSRSLLVLVLCSTQAASAQPLPFPTSNAIWVNTLYMMASPPPLPTWNLVNYANLCANGADTVINTITYTKLEHCAGGYKGAFRDEDGRVFYVPGDSIQEYLLYDFTLSDGDTAFNVYFEPAMGGYGMVEDVVISNTMISAELEGRKVLYTLGGAVWIEGIGAEWGLFSEPWVNVSKYMLKLECMSHQDTIRYPSWNIGVGVCALMDGMGRDGMVTRYYLQPNPTVDGSLIS